LHSEFYTDIYAQVAATNAKIHSLAAVINGPSVNGFLNDPGFDWNVSCKWAEAESAVYVFVAPKWDAPASVTKTFTFTPTVPPTGIQVVGESRSVGMSANGFSDLYTAVEDVHIYKVPVPVAGGPPPIDPTPVSGDVTLTAWLPDLPAFTTTVRVR
jgi:hypothetical protein